MQINLKELRRRCNLTQIELATQSGVPRSRIQLFEAGSSELRPDELDALRKALKSGLEKTAQLLATDPELLSTMRKDWPEKNLRSTDNWPDAVPEEP